MSPKPSAPAIPGSDRASVNDKGYSPRDIVNSRFSITSPLKGKGWRAGLAKCYATESVVGYAGVPRLRRSSRNWGALAGRQTGPGGWNAPSGAQGRRPGPEV